MVYALLCSANGALHNSCLSRFFIEFPMIDCPIVSFCMSFWNAEAYDILILLFFHFSLFFFFTPLIPSCLYLLLEAEGKRFILEKFALAYIWRTIGTWLECWFVFLTESLKIHLLPLKTWACALNRESKRAKINKTLAKIAPLWLY